MSLVVMPSFCIMLRCVRKETSHFCRTSIQHSLSTRDTLVLCDGINNWCDICRKQFTTAEFAALKCCW